MEVVGTVLIVAAALFGGAYVIDRWCPRLPAAIERWMVR